MVARLDHAAVLAAQVDHKLHIEKVHHAAGMQQNDNKAKTEPAENSPLPRQTRPDFLRRTGTYPELSAQVNNSTSPQNKNNNNNNITTTTTSITSSTPRPRNRSPLAHSHIRSRSHASSLAPNAPPIIRAHSLPSARTADHFSSSPATSPFLSPTSPMRSPSMDGTHSPLMASSLYDGAIESISEDAELDLSSRSNFEHSTSLIPVHAALNSSRTLAVRRQRPTSPLRSLGGSSIPSHTNTPRSSSGPPSPSFASIRSNEGFPTLHHASSTSSFSSVSSTPSSARSRSPSISSLDTIEDTPDLEWEAIEADRIAKLHAATQAADNANNEEPRRRGSLEIPGTRTGAGFGFGRRGADANRKRWSICGGERRADLDLETIWED